MTDQQLPTITGDPAQVTHSLPLDAGVDATRVRAAFGVALHMHQPTVLGDGAPTTAPLISNLQRMFERPGEGDNHNASVFLHCYGRSADLVGGLVARGLHPRLMLDYSGNLLWGLAQMGQTDVLAALRRTTEPALAPSIEYRHHVVASPPRRRRRSLTSELHMPAWRRPLRRPVQDCWRSPASVASRRPRWACPSTPTPASPTCARCAGADTSG